MMIYVIVAFVLLADPSLAWGPITHLAHGSELLAVVPTLAVGIRQLLRNYPHHYLYGCVGADITLGKKYTSAQQLHCHSWAVGWQVVQAARSDPERAFGFGYLTHLASDVFSHNHYVPTQLIVSFRSNTQRHIYWEARFDNLQDHTYRELVTMVRRRQFPECDKLLERVIARTLFSFRTNKRIFNSVMALHDWTNWHEMVERVGSRSRHDLPPETVNRYNTLCHHSIVDLMQHEKKATCQRGDPTGLGALSQATEIRSTLRKLARRNALTPEIEQRLQLLNGRENITDILNTAAALTSIA